MFTSLTETQSEILRFIESRIQKNAGAPTCREICDHFKFRSPKAATDHLAAIERKGYISRDRKQARGIRVLKRTTGIPMYGQIPAGPAVEAVTSSERLEFDVESFGVRNREHAFALTVKGNSMEGRHIFDGDLVLIEAGVEPEHRNVVAALIDNETTLKTFSRHDGAVWLHAENPIHSDPIPAWGLQIQGVARAVIRVLRK